MITPMTSYTKQKSNYLRRFLSYSLATAVLAAMIYFSFGSGQHRVLARSQNQQERTAALNVRPGLAANTLEERKTTFRAATNYPQALSSQLPFATTYYAYRVVDDGGLATPAICSSYSGSGANATNNCSLRSAINLANSTAHDASRPSLIILKTYSNGGSYIINRGQLPNLGNDIYLSNDPTLGCPGGYANTTTLDFLHNPASTNGLVLGTSNYLSGIEVINSSANGIVIEGSNNKLTCTFSIGNTGNGIVIDAGAANNKIGGIAGNGGTPGNLEVGSLYNGGYGLVITGSGASGNTVQNSGIGYLPGVTNRTGDNNAGGILIGAGANNNTIGSNVAAQVNLISGNGQHGIMISDPASQANKVWGNFIGTDESGSQSFSNGHSGILLTNGANNNTVGGERGQGFGNLISGNNTTGTDRNNHGVEILGANFNLVQGNKLGVNVNLSASLSNAGNGVFIHGGSHNNQIGGEEDNNAQLGNIASGNGSNGIFLSDIGTSNNLIVGNRAGTDDTGNRAINNFIDGIRLQNGASNNQIGGSGPGQANLVIANGNGISMLGSGTNYNRLYGNFIGVNPNGNGSVQGNTYDGIYVSGAANYNQIGGSAAGQGNLISGNRNNGIEFTNDPSTGNVLQGNRIGTNLAGTAAIPNMIDGISIRTGSNFTIGGSAVGQGNLISGNNSVGIDVFGDVNLNDIIKNVLIQGNFIGTDLTGNVAIPNGRGIILDVSNNSQIGGDRGNGPGLGIGAANLISGNESDAIYLYTANNSQVQGNIIGLNISGTQPLPNGIGLEIARSNQNTIGGEEDSRVHLGNIIASNKLYAIEFINSNQNHVYGNRIGTDAAAGTLDFGNGGDGVLFYGSSSSNIVGGSNSGQANIISHNAKVYFNLYPTDSGGVDMGVNDTRQNTVSHNTIYDNAGTGINLSTNGVYGGSDTGTNNQPQIPTINSARVGRTLTLSGRANPNSIVEVFLGDQSSAIHGTSQPVQGRTYLASTNADANGNFSLSNSSLPDSLVITATGSTLVATSTLNDPAYPQRKGSTSQFSLPFTPTLLPVLAVATNLNPDLKFTTTPGSPTPLTQSLQLAAYNGNINTTSTVSYRVIAGGDGTNPTSSSSSGGWLSLYPTNSGITSGSSQSVTLTISAANLTTDGIYAAQVTFSDAADPTDQVVLNVALTVANFNYSYYLPFLANGTSSGYTSYLVFQNTSNNPAATAIIQQQYFDTSGNPLNTATALSAINCLSVAVHGECVAGNPFASGASGSGLILSDQPLAVIVAEGTPYGGSAYSVSAGAGNALVAPLIFHNAYGDFNTQLTIFNGGSSPVVVSVNFYDQNGSLQNAATQNVTIQPKSSQVLDQALGSSQLPNNFAGWAQISSPAGSKLVAQVLEQSASQKFVAIVNAQTQPPSPTLYAPAIFKGAFNFVTGANIINPNSTPVNVTVTYYADNGTAISTAPFVLPAHAVQAIYQGGNGGTNGLPAGGGLPAGFSGAAIVNSSSSSSNSGDGAGVVMVVNEGGGVTTAGTSLSGVYTAAAKGSPSVGLPVMANGGYGYTTGATIFNTSDQLVSGTIQYYDINGNAVIGAQPFTIGAHASQLAYQGAQNLLPANFYGTAIVSQTSGGATNGNGSSGLIVTTNALSGLFYTYTEPN